MYYGLGGEEYDIRHINMPVVFEGKGGYDHDLEHARKFLEVGKTYTAVKCEIHAWHSYYFLVEVPGQKFNTVMFDKF